MREVLSFKQLQNYLKENGFQHKYGTLNYHIEKGKSELVDKKGEPIFFMIGNARTIEIKNLNILKKYLKSKVSKNKRHFN